MHAVGSLAVECEYTWSWMMRTVAFCTLLLFGTLSCLGQASREPETFFKQHMGLQDDQVADIRHGKAVTKALSTSTPAEVVVFGAVYINGSVEDYLKAAQNVNSLRGSPGYLGVQRFSTPRCSLTSRDSSWKKRTSRT